MAEKSTYRLLGEDEHLFHIEHPDGSQFSIAKQAIGPGVHEHIKSLEPVKHYDEGTINEPGGVVPDSIDVSNNINQPPSNSPLANGGLFPVSAFTDNPIADNSLYVGNTAEPPKSGPLTENIIPSSISEYGKPPVGLTTQKNTEENRKPSSEAQGQVPNPIGDAYDKAYQQKISGVKGIAAAQEEAGKQQAEAYKAQADQIAQSQKNYLDERAKLDEEHQQLMQSVLDHKFDPRSVYHNMNTGDKIGAAISVLLSGIGSGLTGKSNMAMDVLQKSQDRDIEAQRMDLGKKQTLLSENLRKYGDLNQATQATQLQMNAITQARVSQSAAQSGSKQAQFQAQSVIGDLGIQAAQMKQQMALTQANAKSLGYGGNNQAGIPEGQEPYQLLSDPKYQEKRVVVTGDKGNSAFQARDKEAATDMNRTEALYKPIQQDVALLKDLGRTGVITSPEGRERANAALSRLETNVSQFNGQKKFSDASNESIKEQFRNPGAISSLYLGEGSTNDTLNSLRTKLESERAQNLIGYKAPPVIKSFKAKE